MYSLALMMTLTTSVNVPYCHRGHHGCGCYSYGGCYGGSYGCYGCYGYGGGYGCCGYGGYAYGGGGGGYDVASYPKDPDETDEEYAYCQGKAREMQAQGEPPGRIRDFRSNWLQMSHKQRKERMAKDKKGGGTGSEGSLPRPAQILVSLPADARLTIDEEKTQSGGTTRLFVSPPLRPDRSYSYTLKAQFVRDGKTVSLTKKASVSAGAETRVSFEDQPQQRVASK